MRRGAERQGKLGGGAEIARERDDARGRRGGWGGDALFEHALEALDIEHVGVERDGAGLGDARRAVAAHEAEQRIDAPHARPRQGAVEQRGGVAADDLAGCVGLATEGVDIAHARRHCARRDNHWRRWTGRRAPAADAS